MTNTAGKRTQRRKIYEARRKTVEESTVTGPAMFDAILNALLRRVMMSCQDKSVAFQVLWKSRTSDGQCKSAFATSHDVCVDADHM